MRRAHTARRYELPTLIPKDTRVLCRGYNVPTAR
jgi:hypothetical protein